MSQNTPHTPHDFAKLDKTAGQASHDTPVHLAPGKVIMDKFEVIELLGCGGMGSVFKVQHTHLKTFYAMKCLNHKQGNDAIWRRFDNEARAANRLDHPNLIRVHDSGLLPDGQPYFVMDLVDGSTLAQILESRGTLNLATALKIFIQVGFALAYAHANGVIHRDIKPSNIMLVKSVTGSLGGSVKVVDFGIAKLTGQDEYNQQTLTRTGEIFGSPLYMSPEQCMGVGVDHRSDLYSLGCVMYEALTGAPPVVGDNALSTMLKHQNEIPSLMHQASLGLEFPDSIEFVVAKLLEKDPSKRYPNASLLTADLVAIEQGHIFDNHDFAEEAKTLVSINREIPARKKREKQQQNLFGWIVALAIGFAIGFASAKINVSNEQPKPAQKKPPIYSTFVSVPPNMGDEEQSTDYFADLNSQPFSRIRDRRRIFSFPENRKLCMICRGDWTSMGPAIGELTFDPFHPLNIIVYNDINPSSQAFTKFRNDEIGGVKLSGLQSNVDKFLRVFASYENLSQLSLESCNFSKNEIPLLERLTKLEFLNLKGTDVNGKEICELSVLPRLKILDIGAVQDVSYVLDKIKDSKPLLSLGLASCNLSEGDLRTISKIQNLEILDIGKNEVISAKTLAILSKLNLKRLNLKDCKFTPDMIPRLKSFKTLQTVSFTNRGMAPDDISRINRELSPIKVEITESIFGDAQKE
jgi:serine/threonine protein kinase